METVNIVHSCAIFPLVEGTWGVINIFAGWGQWVGTTPENMSVGLGGGAPMPPPTRENPRGTLIFSDKATIFPYDPPYEHRDFDQYLWKMINLYFSS